MRTKLPLYIVSGMTFFLRGDIPLRAPEAGTLVTPRQASADEGLPWPELQREYINRLTDYAGAPSQERFDALHQLIEEHRTEMLHPQNPPPILMTVNYIDKLAATNHSFEREYGSIVDHLRREDGRRFLGGLRRFETEQGGDILIPPAGSVQIQTADDPTDQMYTEFIAAVENRESIAGLMAPMEDALGHAPYFDDASRQRLMAGIWAYEANHASETPELDELQGRLMETAQILRDHTRGDVAGPERLRTSEPHHVAFWHHHHDKLPPSEPDLLATYRAGPEVVIAIGEDEAVIYGARMGRVMRSERISLR